MNSILKILLDHPAKVEKIFLWFLQSAIIIWIMSSFFGYNVIDIKFVQGHLETNFVMSLSAINLATCLLLFTLSWILIWGFLADLLFQLLFVSMNWIIRQFITLLKLLFNSFLYPILLMLSWFKIVKKPKLFWKKDNNSESSSIEDDNVFQIRMNQQLVDMELFSFLNKWTKSAIGSEFVLELISMEKGEFIQSRMIRYYTITVIIAIVQLNAFNFSENFFTIICVILFILVIGFIISGFNDLYRRLNENNLFYLIPQLEFEVYLDYIYNNFKESIINDDFEIVKKRKFLSLSIKENSKNNDYKNQNLIEVVPLFEKAIPSIEIINRFRKSNSLVVYISESIPDISIRNQIVKNKQCLIVAKSQDELFEGIKKLYPIIIGEIQLK